MSTVKRISGDYMISTVDGNVYVDTQNFTIDGNLIVIHSIANVDSINNYIYENFITLEAGQSGGPILDAGIYISRGDPEPPAALRWHETASQWEVNDTTGWLPLGRTIVYQDKTPMLGGNLNTHGFSIYSDTGNVTIDSSLVVEQITSDPTPTPGYSTLYAKETKSGNTGFYISNEKKVGEELITKKKAFLYSIIL